MQVDKPLTRLASVLLALGVVGLAAGCGSTNTVTTIHTPTSQASSAKTRSSRAGPTKVLMFIEENHSLDQMKAGMPYLSGLAHQYAYATNYRGVTHPSEPNYLAIAGGSTFGVTRDQNPSINGLKVGNARSVFSQALARGHTAKTYMESMPHNCAQTPSGLYGVKHNPWAYFSKGRANCRKFDVPIGDPARGPLATDIAHNTLPNVGLVVPNLCDDAHNNGCSLKGADDWLKNWLQRILHSRDFTSGRLVVVVTADEDHYTMDNRVLTVVLNAKGPHKLVVTRPLDHYSLSGFCSHIVGAPPLLNAATAHSMAHAFGL